MGIEVAKINDLDAVLDELAATVTKWGPKHLIRGMTQLEANTAILECIKRLIFLQKCVHCDSVASLCEDCHERNLNWGNRNA
jgi:hypothetical protein